MKKLNERGATLAIVLLVILVFSILGLAVMGSVVGENKRVNVTESDVQARYLAENGLTYFENNFKKYITDTSPSDVDVTNYIETNYGTFQSVGDPGSKDETKIMATINNDNVVVTSKGKAGGVEKTLYGYYQVFDIIKTPSFEIISFNKDGTIKVNFTPGIAHLGLLGDLINLFAVNLPGDSKKYYPVPTDSNILELQLLNSVLGLTIPTENSFQTMKNYRVIASNDAGLLNLNVSNLAFIDLFPFQGVSDLNVVIDGRVPVLSLLGLTISDYKNIDLKKLAVMGNARIQQAGGDTSLSRSFRFDEGLYVNKSLTIGDSSQISKLNLQGDMVAMQDLTIKKAVLTFSGNSHLYVWGNATVDKSTINIDNTNSQNDFGLLAIGKITINNDKPDKVYKGLFYSRTRIDIKTNNMPMTINGGLIGNYTVDYPDKLTVITDPKYLKLEYIKLIPKGRSFDNKPSNK